MELPTYTSIWRIEKRLYKLYDFRLPMPLPVGQIAVFTAITVPYVILLTLFGLPFSHTLFWLYVLPPGVLTWLATRPDTFRRFAAKYHTSTPQLAYLACEAKPRLLVLYHFSSLSPEELLADLSSRYSGHFVVGRDLDVY